MPASNSVVGFASGYDVERKFRETRLYRVAPISTNLILSMWPNMFWACRGPFDVCAETFDGSKSCRH